MHYSTTFIALFVAITSTAVAAPAPQPGGWPAPAHKPAHKPPKWGKPKHPAPPPKWGKPKGWGKPKKYRRDEDLEADVLAIREAIEDSVDIEDYASLVARAEMEAEYTDAVNIPGLAARANNPVVDGGLPAVNKNYWGGWKGGKGWGWGGHPGWGHPGWGGWHGWPGKKWRRDLENLDIQEFETRDDIYNIEPELAVRDPDIEEADVQEQDIAARAEYEEESTVAADQVSNNAEEQQRQGQQA